MSEFVRVASASELPDPGKKMLELDDRLLVLFHVGGRFYCLDDVCTHDGGPLGEGRLDGFEIACPRHGARFDIRTGCVKSMPATEATLAYPVRVVGDDVFVSLVPGGSVEAGEESPVESTAALAGASDAGASGAGASAAVAPAGSAAPVHGDGANCCGGSAPPSAACATPHEPVVTMGPLTEDRVREELKRVIDPELFVNIVDLGLVYVVDLHPAEEGKTQVKIEMTMTSPMCPAGPQLIGQSKQFVSNLPQVSGVEVKLVMDPPWSPDRMTDAARDQLGIF